MNMRLFYPLLIFVLLFCRPSAGHAQTFTVKLDSLDLFDSVRQRAVPVALYIPGSAANTKHPLVILSHGYNANQPGSNKNYSYLAATLASKGYFVASIQHELPTDSLIPSTGIIPIVRKPFWDQGVANILFVLNDFKRRYPGLDFTQISLVGHSNGGDMSMLFAQRYPLLVHKVLSLDNRRVAFPRASQPKLYSLRSSDQLADEGVLPTAAEQKKYGITIIQLRNTLHNDMNDHANAQQRRQIIQYILGFLKER